MAAKTPTWVWIVFGIVGVDAILCIAVVGGGILMFRQHVHTDALPKQAALQEFDPANPVCRTAAVGAGRQGRRR